MKRVIALTMAVLMIAALLVACGGPEGKYVVKSIDGKTVDEAIKESAEAAGMSVDDMLKQMGINSADEIVTLELKSDGTAVMEVKMFSTTKEGKWEKNGDKITITIDDQPSNFTLKGNELHSEDGDQKYVFVKK